MQAWPCDLPQRPWVQLDKGPHWYPGCDFPGQPVFPNSLSRGGPGGLVRLPVPRGCRGQRDCCIFSKPTCRTQGARTQGGPPHLDSGLPHGAGSWLHGAPCSHLGQTSGVFLVQKPRFFTSLLGTRVASPCGRIREGGPGKTWTQLGSEAAVGFHSHLGPQSAEQGGRGGGRELWQAAGSAPPGQGPAPAWLLWGFAELVAWVRPQGGG